MQYPVQPRLLTASNILGGQPFVQQICGLFAPHLFPDSSQPAVLRQTLARVSTGSRDCRAAICTSWSNSSSLTVMPSASAIRSSSRNGLDLGDGAVALGGAQAGKVQLAHLLGVHALRRQGAQAALQARVNLLLHQRLGNREGELLGQRGKQPVLGFAFNAAALAVGHVLANAVFQLGQSLVVAHFLGEVVVQLGHGALLDRLHRHVVGDRLAGQLGLGVIGGIDDLGLQFLPGFGAAQDGR